MVGEIWSVDHWTYLLKIPRDANLVTNRGVHIVVWYGFAKTIAALHLNFAITYAEW